MSEERINAEKLSEGQLLLRRNYGVNFVFTPLFIISRAV